MKPISARIPIFVLAVLLLTLPAAVQAQFTFTTNNYDSLNISGYTGSGGAVVIPTTTNGLTIISIGANAFQSCSSLTSVTIPTSVTSIGQGAFVGCSSLTNISVDVDSSWFSSINGVLFDREQDTLIDYPAGLTNGTYTVPISVTNIGQYAFTSCSGLTSITIPRFSGNLSIVGEFAFSGCTGLASVTITNAFALGSTSIGAAAFTFCPSLTNVLIYSSVTNVGGLAFSFCTNLTSVFFESNAPPDVGTAFYGDPAAVVYYPPGATGWGTTFGGARTELETPTDQFDYAVIDGSITIEQYYGPLGPVGIPPSINGYAVTSIGVEAFENNRATSVTIPNTVTSIGYGAFLGCGNLTNVTIGNNVTNIGEYAFQNCPDLTHISVNAANPSYSSLNGVLFDKPQDTLIDYPPGLASGTYIVPNSVTGIGEEAFYRCTNLTNVFIGNSVTHIGEWAFEFCTGLASAYFQGNAPPDVGNTFYDDPAAVVYYLPGTIGWGTTFGGAPTVLWNPQAATFMTEGNQFGFNITGATNITVVVEACTNVANPVWLPVSTNTLSSSGTSPFTDPQWTNYPNRYYRFSAP